MSSFLQLWMLQNDRNRQELMNRQPTQLQNSHAISDTLPGVRTFADVLQAMNMYRDTLNKMQWNRQLKEDQDYLRGKGLLNGGNNVNNSNNGYSYDLRSDNVKSDFGSLFGNNQLQYGEPVSSIWDDKTIGNLLGGQNSFSEPTSELAQRSVGEVPQSATLGNKFDVLKYMELQPVQQYVQQLTPQQVQQPQQMQRPLSQPQGNVDYLSDAYAMHNWVPNNSGGRPDLDVMRYSPYGMLREAAKEARTQDAMRQYLTSSDPEVKRNALIQLSIDYNNPTLEEDIQSKREASQLAKDKMLVDAGFMPSWMEGAIGGSGNTSAGNSVLNVLDGFKEGEQWMADDGNTDPDRQCASYATHVLRKSGVDIKGSANGDELMNLFKEKNAYNKGTLDGIQPGDIIDFPKHVAFYIGNGKYKARNSKGGIHTGTLEDAVATFGQPLGYASVGKYTGGSRGNGLKQTPKAQRLALKDLADIAYKNALLGLREKEVAIKLAKYLSENGNGSGGLSKKDLDNLDKSQKDAYNIALGLSETGDLLKRIKTNTLTDSDPWDIKESEVLKNYNTQMNKYSQKLGDIFGLWTKENNINGKKIVDVAKEFYDDMNLSKTGLTSEELTEAVARAVASDPRCLSKMSAQELQKELYHLVNNGGNSIEEDSTPTEMEEDSTPTEMDDVEQTTTNQAPVKPTDKQKLMNALSKIGPLNLSGNVANSKSFFLSAFENNPTRPQDVISNIQNRYNPLKYMQFK